MIFQLSNSAINQQAVQALILTNPQTVLLRGNKPGQLDPSDTVLTIVDLDANGLVQHYLKGSILAKRLVEGGLLEYTTRIQLLISDISSQQSMLGYATELSQTLLTLLPQSSIDVHVVAKICDATLVEPPSDPTAPWIIYTLPSDELEALVVPKEGYHQGSFDFFKRHMPTVLFQGDILETLKERKYTIAAEEVKATYGIEQSFGI